MVSGMEIYLLGTRGRLRRWTCVNLTISGSGRARLHRGGGTKGQCQGENYRFSPFHPAVIPHAPYRPYRFRNTKSRFTHSKSWSSPSIGSDHSSGRLGLASPAGQGHQASEQTHQRHSSTCGTGRENARGDQWPTTLHIHTKFTISHPPTVADTRGGGKEAFFLRLSF